MNTLEYLQNAALASGADGASWALVATHDGLVRLRVAQLGALDGTLACAACAKAPGERAALLRITTEPYRDARPPTPLLARTDAGVPSGVSRAGAPPRPYVLAPVCAASACCGMAHRHLCALAHCLYPAARDAMPVPPPRDCTLLASHEALWAVDD